MTSRGSDLMPVCLLGIGLVLAASASELMRGVLSHIHDIYLFLMIIPRTSFHYKLVPVQYYEGRRNCH